MIEAGLVHVPLEVKTCTELRPAANPVAVAADASMVAPLGMVTVSPDAPSVRVVPVEGCTKLVSTVLIRPPEFL